MKTLLMTSYFQLLIKINPNLLGIPIKIIVTTNITLI